MSITQNPLWNPRARLVLASESLTRKQLLEACGIPFVAMAPDLDERAIEDAFLAKGGRLSAVPLVLARAKAEAVNRRALDALCLGADQMLWMDGKVFHKPKSRAEAITALEQLSGRTHQLVSAYAIAFQGGIVQEGEDIAELSMRELSRQQIERYLDVVGDRAFDSVGGYQVESIGLHLFRVIQGAHSTVLGLPMLRVLEALRALQALRI